MQYTTLLHCELAGNCTDKKEIKASDVPVKTH